MTEAEIKSTALFFFLALLNDHKAIELSGQAVFRFSKENLQHSKLSREELLIRTVNRIWMNDVKKMARGVPSYSMKSGWNFPEGLDMGAWREFQKSSQKDELCAVIWSRILKFNEESVTRALEISSGTLRYRLGRALRKLGSLTGSLRPVTSVRPT